jgi:hypothetical protein
MKIIGTAKRQDETTVGINEEGYIVVAQECSLGGDTCEVWIAPENVSSIACLLMEAVKFLSARRALQSVNQLTKE